MARKSALTPPRDDAPDLPLEFSPMAGLLRDAVYEGVEWNELTDTDGTSTTIRESIFSGTNADTVSLKFSTLTDVEFRQTRFASLQLRGSRLSRVRFAGGRIGTLDLTEAGLDAVVLDGVRIDYLTLGRASVTDVDVRGCRIDTLDMPTAKINRLRFTDSIAGELDPREAIAKDVDLRGLDFARITDMGSLRGMTISRGQAELAAVSLATSAGILVAN